MKKKLFILILSSLLFYCKTKKKTGAPAGNSNTKTESRSGAPKSELEIAQKRWAGTTSADLSEGKNIFETKCTRCHGAKNILTRSEENWKASIAKMAPRAKLTEEEKDKLTRYILSYREAHTSAD